MATWEHVVEHVSRTYRVANRAPLMLQLIFETSNGRSQMVFLCRQALDDDREEWLQIESPIGHLDEVSLREALVATQNLVCGGLGLTGEHVTFKHSVPLEDMSLTEFERPLQLVISTADLLEKQLTGADRY